MEENIGNRKLDGAMDERARTMHMLFPFRSVCDSFVVLRPLGVISLQAGQQMLGREERETTYYSVTSSRTMSGERRGVFRTAVVWVGEEIGQLN